METARYIKLPHIILTDLDIPAIDVVATAICWLLGKKPIEMDEYTPERTKEITESLRSVQASVVSDHIIVFIGMAGLMTFAKKYALVHPDNNNKFLQKRWQIVCATASIPNMIEQKTMSQDTYMSIINCLVKWQTWIKPDMSFYKKFLDYALENNEENILIKSALTQVKIVLQNYDQRWILFTEAFVTTYDLINYYLLLPNLIIDQAVALKKMFDELQKKYGDQFPFLKLYQFEGAENMDYRLYSDLFYAAVCICIKTEILSPTAKYLITELQTTIPKDEITKYVEAPFTLQRMKDKILEKRFLGKEFWTWIPQSYKRQNEEEKKDKEEDTTLN